MPSKKLVGQKVEVEANGGPSELRDLVHRMLELLGEDPERNGLLRTPERVDKALRFMTKGYGQDLFVIHDDAWTQMIPALLVRFL